MATDFRLKDQLPDITERIVATYERSGKINHLDHCPLPRYDEIVAAIQELNEIMFPGYRRREGLHQGNISYYVGDLVDRLHDRLTSRSAAPCATTPAPPAIASRPRTSRRWARRRRSSSSSNFPRFARSLATDVQAAYDGDPACKSPAEVIFCYPGLEAITVYRLAHLLYELSIPFIPRMMSEWAHSRTGIDIHPGATIGRISSSITARASSSARRAIIGSAREAVPRRDPRRAQLPDRRGRQPRSRPEAASRRSKTASSSTPTPRSSAAAPSSATTR
jgi:serine O-acetyltransferase